MKKLKVLDLFAGIGGFSLGLETTGGFETIAFCEKDKDCQDVLKNCWPGVPQYEDVSSLKYLRTFYDSQQRIDINLLGSTDNLPGDHIEALEIDVLTGGFPCQDISFAGNQKGIKGERSGLWKEYHRLIKEIRPKYAIIENVEHLRKNGLGVVLNDLARIGYDAEWACIPARSVGYPHQRKRLFIISYPSSKRQYEYTGEERHLQTNQEWESATLYSEGQQCESESIKVRPILSKGAFDSIRSSYPDEGAAVSDVCRVTDGIPERPHEADRKRRIKQLGNAIVPRIAEIIGQAILRRENE